MKTPAVTLDTTSPEKRRWRSNMVVVRCRNVTWLALPQWQAFLCDAGTLNWFCLAEQPDTKIVKRGDGRTVWRVSVGRQIVYAKVTNALGGGARVKHWLSLSAYHREWRSLLRARRLGVAAVEPIALGFQHGKPRRAVLLTEGNAGSASLDEVWRRDVEQAGDGNRATAVRRLSGHIAELFTASHEHGFLHGDAHPKNILLENHNPKCSKAFFVDLAGAGISRRPVCLRHSLRSLAQLDQYFHRVATKTERLRFLNRYFEGRPRLRTQWRKRDVRQAWLLQLRKVSRQHGVRLARTRDRRINKNNPYFMTTTLEDGWRLQAVLKLARRHVCPEPDVTDRTESDWRRFMARVLPRAAQADTGPLAIDEDGLRCKVHSICGLGARITASIFGSDHRRRFDECHRQRHRDIRNHLVLACVEHRSYGLIDKTLIIERERETETRACRKD